MDVLTVCVGADQNFVSLIVLGQLQRGRVSGDRVDCFAFREALYHVIEQYTVRLVVEPLGGHEIRVDRFRLTVDTCDQLLPLELGLFILHGIPHHGAHASGGLAPLVVCEADDTKTILEDLCGEGALEFLTRVQSREYDESRAVLATYLYPHLKGRMTRWLEQHIGNLSLSKHEMDAVRQAQRLYHSGQFSIEEIAEKMDVLLEQAVKHIRYNTHFVGVNDLIPGSYDGDPFERLMPGNLSVSAEQVVYRKVCIELLQELFDALPKKDRDILGKFYGVFGFEKTSLKEIGMYHMMKESAVEKAKERAVTKLKKAYPGSRLQIWRNVHRMIRRPILPAKDDRALRRSFTTSTLRNQESGRS